MEKTTEAKAPCPLAVMDEQHREFLRAGLYSGEGCWFQHGDDADFAAAYLQARAKVAELVAAAHDAEVMFNTVRGCYERNPGNFAFAMQGFELESLPRLRTALAAFSEVQ